LTGIQNYFAATRLPDLIVVALLTFVLTNVNNKKKESRDNKSDLEEQVQTLTLEKLEANLTKVINGVQEEIKKELIPIKQNQRDLVNELRYKGVITQTQPLDLTAK
jgi:adenosyl cobinamide kinase/adenosyl cobinamide phosphate guanylyltransferase